MKKVLIIIQRSNGDVYLSSPLIDGIQAQYPEAKIDLLINDDTLGIAKTLKNINDILLYSYKWRKKGRIYRFIQELKLAKKVWKKYDAAVCLTASDRSVFYAIVAGKMSVGVVEGDRRKSWWKRRFLSRAFVFNDKKHTVANNSKPLEFLNAKPKKLIIDGQVGDDALKQATQRINDMGLKKFVIYHPTAQYIYKVYPEANRTKLLTLLNDHGVDVIVTGTSSQMDTEISNTIPDLPHIHNLMGKTSLAECIALTKLSEAYIGMDTLNMHIAAGFNKPVFAIFGPTFPIAWSPWSNDAQRGANQIAPVQQYGNVTMFQGNLPCVACGLAGCDNKGLRSECLFDISPTFIFRFFKQYWEANQGEVC